MKCIISTVHIIGIVLHPGRLTWNLQITHLERKMILQTSMIMFHVNLPGVYHHTIISSYPSKHQQNLPNCLVLAYVSCYLMEVNPRLLRRFLAPLGISQPPTEKVIRPFLMELNDYISHTIHVWYIFLHLPNKIDLNVGVYIIPCMDAMGFGFQKQEPCFFAGMLPLKVEINRQ